MHLRILRKTKETQGSSNMSQAAPEIQDVRNKYMADHILIFCSPPASSKVNIKVYIK